MLCDTFPLSFGVFECFPQREIALRLRLAEYTLQKSTLLHLPAFEIIHSTSTSKKSTYFKYTSKYNIYNK